MLSTIFKTDLWRQASKKTEHVFASKKLSIFLEYAFMSGLYISLVVVTGVLMAQLSSIIQIFSFTSYLMLALLLVVLLASLKVTDNRAITFLCIVLALFGILLRWKSINYLNLEPISDLLITFKDAVNWVTSPAVALHDFIFPHWGIYGIFLRDWFTVFGPSVMAAKFLNIVAYILVVAAVYLYTSLDNTKRLSKIGIVALAACYPTFVFYVNFLSGEYLFMGLFSISMVLLMLIKKTEGQRHYYLLILGFAVFLSLASLLKQMSVITLPVSLFCITYFLVKRRLTSKIIPTFLIIACISILIPVVMNMRLQHYSRGPVNHHLTNLFLASGLSVDSQGQLNPRYYNPYVADLTQAYRKGALTDEVYKSESDKLSPIVKSELENFASIPILFDTKLRFIWSNDNNISVWFFTGKSQDKAHAKPLLDNMSNVFYLTLTILFMTNIYRTLKMRDDDFVNLFAVLMVSLYVLASLFIEGQARYRIIIIPSLLIGAAGGLNYLIELYSRINSSKSDL